MSIFDLFCSVDEFWQQFAPWWQRQLLASGARQRLRPTRLHPSEIMTIAILRTHAHFPHECLTIIGRIGGGAETHGRGDSGGREGRGEGSDAYVAERLDHLGIVAGVCQEIGVAEWLDAQDEQSHERVGVGTATVAMILNGLGFSNRRLYLVWQFFANKPIERLLGPGITAEDLNDDCLGRTLDWLYAHDPTTLFAGLALRTRRAFGISTRQVHVETTSFAVTGEYAADEDAQTLAVTYGWLLAGPPRRPQAVDVGAGDHAARRRATILPSLEWQCQ